MQTAKRYCDSGFYTSAFLLVKTEAETMHDIYAKYDVGMMLAFRIGVPVNLKQAKEWLEKAVGIGEIGARLLGLSMLSS